MNLYGYEIQRESDLVHYGVKGQKWGQRRYQLLDGSLTPLGMRRLGYGSGSNHSSSPGSSKVGVPKTTVSTSSGKNVSYYNISSKIPHAKEKIVASKVAKDVWEDLRDHPDPYDPKSLAESNSEFRLTLGEISGLDDRNFTDKEIEYMRSQYLTGIKERELMKELYKEIDVSAEKDPRLHPETFAESPREFRGIIGEFVGNKGDWLSDEQVERLYKEYKKHYDDIKKSETDFYNRTDETKSSTKKKLLSSSKSVSKDAKTTIKSASESKPTKISKPSKTTSAPSVASNILMSKVNSAATNAIKNKGSAAGASILNKIKKLSLTAIKKK